MMTRKEELDWLAVLKPGDDAVYGRIGNGVVLVRVTKITATQIVCDRQRFNRKSGKMVGQHGVRAVWLRPVTADDREQFVRRRALWTLEREVQHYAKDIPTATLVSAARLLTQGRTGHE